MIIIVIVIFLVDRWITKVSCLALYKGKWKKIEKSITGENIFEKITLSYLVKKSSQYKMQHKIFIFFDVISVNICMLFTVAYSLAILVARFESIFGMAWCISIMLHIIIRILFNLIIY